MRLVVQRVTRAEVRVDGAILGAIGRGAAVLVGIGVGDTPELADRLADRLLGWPTGCSASATSRMARGGRTWPSTRSMARSWW